MVCIKDARVTPTVLLYKACRILADIAPYLASLIKQDPLSAIYVATIFMATANHGKT